MGNEKSKPIFFALHVKAEVTCKSEKKSDVPIIYVMTFDLDHAMITHGKYKAHMGTLANKPL